MALLPAVVLAHLPAGREVAEREVRVVVVVSGQVAFPTRLMPRWITPEIFRRIPLMSDWMFLRQGISCAMAGSRMEFPAGEHGSRLA